MEEYKDKLNSFASRIRSETPNIPLQEVRPIKTKEIAKEEETQLNVLIPKYLLKSLKKHCLENNITVRDSIIKLIEELVKETKE